VPGNTPSRVRRKHTSEPSQRWAGAVVSAPMKRLTAAMLALAAQLALADDITPEQAAKVERENKKAQEDVAKKYGNKKSSEMSADERREMIADQKAANAKVLEKNGVSAKDYARYEVTANGAQRDAAKASGAALDKKEADQKAAAEKAAAKPADGSAGVVVEKGLPPEEKPQDNRGELLKEMQERATKAAKGKGKSRY
jgi:hypothetical protein